MGPPCYTCFQPQNAHFGVCKFCQDKFIEEIAKGAVEGQKTVTITLPDLGPSRRPSGGRLPARAPDLQATDLGVSPSSRRRESTPDHETDSHAPVRRTWQQVWDLLDESRVPDGALIGVAFLMRGVHAILEYLVRRR